MRKLGINPERLKQGAIIMAVAVAVLWGLEVIDWMTSHALDRWLGIRPWNLGGIFGIIFAPLLHESFVYLAINTFPVFIFGTILWTAGRKEFIVATGASWLASGIAAWLLNPPSQVIVGAGGVVFGWMAYLVLRGFLTGKWMHIGIAIVVALLYGAVLFGAFPTNPWANWPSHLGGAAGGVLAALFLYRDIRKARADKKAAKKA